MAKVLHFAVGEIREPTAIGTGPLGGKRLIVKDLFDVAGEPTCAGCDMPVVEQAPATASAVQMLIDAGASYIGKAQMVQLAFGGWGTNACVGAPRNPWDADVFRVAGGSSSGSAVAVAAGFADIALGSDTGGSIRIPASLCGIVGLKPSQGKISLTGVVPLARSLDSIGPMARRVEDVATTFAVLTDTLPVAAPAQIDNLVFRMLVDDDLVADEDVAAAYRATIDRIATTGALLQSNALPTSPKDYVGPTGQVMGYEAWALHGERIAASRATADPGVLRRFEGASKIDEPSYSVALAVRAEDQTQFEQWFEGANFLITPATARTAPPIAEVDEGDFTLAYYTRMANYLDLCAISLPCGFDRSGLPIGLQLVGRAGDESRLIAAAWAVEQLLALPVIIPPLHISRCTD